MAGLGMVLHHGIERGADLAAYGRLAEERGYDSLWVTERYGHEETFTLLGYLAAATTRLRLGVGVVNPYGRHPTLTAMAAATLDRVSGGRFILGMGRSERDVVKGMLGHSHVGSRPRLRDAVAHVRALLAGEGVRRPDGGTTRLAIRPMQTPLPIHVAAIGPRALRLAGAIADGVVLNAYVPPSYVPWAIDEIRTGARAAGRDPAAIEIGCMLVVRLTDDLPALRPTLKPRVARLLAEAHTGEVLVQTGGFDPDVPSAIRAALGAHERDRATALVTDAMVDAFYVAGPADRCRARVAEYRAAGVTSPLLLPRLPDHRHVAEALAGA